MYERLNKRVQGRHDEGFTLIELLIVIVILGILAAIVVFAIGTTRDDAVASSCKADFKSVELAAEAAKTKTGKYPADKAGLTMLKSYPTSSDYALEYADGVITVSGTGLAGGTTAAGCEKAAAE